MTKGLYAVLKNAIAFSWYVSVFLLLFLYFIYFFIYIADNCN